MVIIEYGVFMAWFTGILVASGLFLTIVGIRSYRANPESLNFFLEVVGIRATTDDRGETESSVKGQDRWR